MIYDGHAYCFPDLRGNGGFSSREQFRKHLQMGAGSHFQPGWRLTDRVRISNDSLVDLTDGWTLDALQDAGFDVAQFGRFEWDVNGDVYGKQYFPPSLREPNYPAAALVAEMDYAGIDMALLHRTPYLGIGNDFIAECCGRYPERLQGLAHVEEWLIRSDTDECIRKLEHAVQTKGLHGLQFLPDHLALYGQSEDWNDDAFTPFWEALSSLNIPLFVTPSYAGLATAKGASSDHVISQLERITTWMNKHPDVRVVLTHGLSWRIFCSGDGLEIPDAVYRAIPVSPYFYLQLLFPISLGDLWEYPMLQVKSTVETLGARIGADHLIWGTDMPIVMRFQTYRQTLEHMYACLSQFSPNDIALVTGGNMTQLMNISSE